MLTQYDGTAWTGIFMTGKEQVTDAPEQSNEHSFTTKWGEFFNTRENILLLKENTDIIELILTMETLCSSEKSLTFYEIL